MEWLEENSQLYWLLVGGGTVFLLSLLVCIVCVVAAGRADRQHRFYYDDLMDWNEP